MLEESKTSTNIGVGIGLALQIAGRVIISMNPSLAFIGITLLLVGLGFFTWGCASYAEGKGYSSVLGFLGVFSVIGLIVLVLLPDKN